MNAQIILESAALLRAQIDCRLSDISQLRALEYRLADLPRVPCPTLDAAVQRMAEHTRSLTSDVADMTARHAQIIALLDRLGDPRLYAVLYRRYILAEDIDTVAALLCYSRRHVCYLQREGLRAVQALLDAEAV